MKPHALRHNLPVVVAGMLFLPTLAFSQQALSHVRVVQLSYVSGTVSLKRPGSTEWAKAQVNTPVQEGFELSTSTDSHAEVRFENGSTARLGELSIVAFSQLAMDAEGNKLNHLRFERGYATFHFMPERQDAYSVKVADATLTPGGKSEFRTDLREGRIRVEVLNGSVAVVAARGGRRALASTRSWNSTPALPKRPSTSGRESRRTLGTSGWMRGTTRRNPVQGTRPFRLGVHNCLLNPRCARNREFTDLAQNPMAGGVWTHVMISHNHSDLMAFTPPCARSDGYEQSCTMRSRAPALRKASPQISISVSFARLGSWKPQSSMTGY